MTNAAKPPRRTKPRSAAEPEQAAALAASPQAKKAYAPEPIGADNLDDAFVNTLKQDFLNNAQDVIEAMRAERPTEYMKIIASLRTKRADEAVDPLRAMSDAELERHIGELAQRAGYEIRRVTSSPQRGGPGGDEGADTD